MKNLTLLSSLLAITLVAGCAKPVDAESASTSTPSNGSVKNAPDPTAAQGAAYRLEPKDPNDPKFKADPKLSGGG
ncbi:hypothetical protein EON81_07315 [bacterium]|nr:MAG: hypothetical protein EON81_07315 [bacterium]